MFQQGHGKENTFAVSNYEAFTLDDNVQIFDYSQVGLTESTKGQTIGAAFDTYTRVFSVIYKNERKNFYIRSATTHDAVEPYIIESSTGTDLYYQDNITVHFGPNFKYQIPYGYLPWSSNIHLSTCQVNRKTSNLIYIIVPSLFQ